jgi:hypothetical protein
VLDERASRNTKTQEVTIRERESDSKRRESRLYRRRHQYVVFLVTACEEEEYRPMLIRWTILSNGVPTGDYGEDYDEDLEITVQGLELYGDEDLFIFEGTGHQRIRSADHIALVDDSTPLAGAASLKPRCRTFRHSALRQRHQRKGQKKSLGRSRRLLRRIRAHYKLYKKYARR